MLMYLNSTHSFSHIRFGVFLSTVSNKSRVVEHMSGRNLKPQLSVLYNSGLRTADSYQDLKSTKSVAVLSFLTRPEEKLMIPGVLLTLETNCRPSLMENTPLINGRKSAFLITLNHSYLGQTLATFELLKGYTYLTFIFHQVLGGFGFWVHSDVE